VRVKRPAGIAVLLAVAAGAVVLWLRAGILQPDSRAANPEARLNVLLITIDTLRADRVGRGFTPAVDALASRGTSFTNVRATAPLTLPSHTSIMTGTLPTVHGVRENGLVFDRKTPTIAHAFKQAGYHTAAFVGAYVLNRRFGLDEGFETYDDAVRRDMRRAESLEAERPANEVVDAALAWLGVREQPCSRPPCPLLQQTTSGQPFFLWVHLYDPHAPYAPPPEYLKKAGGSAYDGEVAFADAQAGRLLDALHTTGLARSTVVAIAGDHGEALGEHGEQTHGMLAYDATLRVPLVIAVPNAERHTDSNVMSLADLGPRLLQAAGIGNRTASLPAYSETRYPRRAGWHALSVLTDERWKLIRSSEPELYEIGSDSLEQKNVASDHPNVVQAMSAAIDKLQAGERTSDAVSAEASERLRALGYVSGSAAISSDDPGAPNPARVIDAWTRFEHALGQLNAGDAEKAAIALQAIAAAHPESMVFQSTYARALKDAGNPKAAVRVYKSAAAKWQTDPALFHDLAVAAREAGDAAEAARAEQAALALDANSAMAQNGLGLLSADAGRHADAAAAFERATKIDPTNASYWTNLGNARRALDDGAGAESAFRKALEVDPEYPDALNGLGVLFVQGGRAAEAIPLFERALKRDGQFHEARLNLGIALQESGQRERAAATYRELLETAPPSARHERDAAVALLRALR
jgi:arylsulfatase A-like enzyme/Flp pilus assembly protein TadD